MTKTDNSSLRCPRLTGAATAAVLGLCALAPGLSAAQSATAEADLVPIPDATVFEGRVLVGGQPTREQLTMAAAAGYRTVVNLRPPGEFEEWDEREVVESLGLRYVSIPVKGGAGLTRQNAESLAVELDSPEGQPMIVHCASGNRVGGLLALKAFYVDGLDMSAAVELGLANGLTSLESAVAEQIERSGSE